MNLDSVIFPSEPKVLVIIPAFNEADSIVGAVESVQAFNYDYIVVNDGSNDDTLEICVSHGFNVLNLSENLGIGGAVQAGHKYALAKGYDVDIQFDGDGQHDARYIANLIDGVVGGNDLVIGSRFVEESEGFRSTFMRRVGIRWISGMIRLMTGRTVTDPTSGFRACGKRAMKLFCEDYPIDYPEPESILSAIQHGFRVIDVPVIMHERQGGESSIRPLSSVYYMVKVSLALIIMSFSGKR